MEDTNVNENKENEKVECVDARNDFQKFKDHLVTHKNKYIIGGLLTLSFGLGFYFGNRGNHKRHYSKLLKDGVKGAVEEGIRDVVHEGMRDVVKDGMRDVVTDVFNDRIKTNIRQSVADTVRNTIRESAVTIIKEVQTQTAEAKPLKNKDIDEIQKLMKHITGDTSGVKFVYDSDGHVYTVSK